MGLIARYVALLCLLTISSCGYRSPEPPVNPGAPEEHQSIPLVPHFDAVPINPGAAVLIFDQIDFEDKNIIGAYFPELNRIEIRDKINRDAKVLVHEYEHLIEQRLVNANDPAGVLVVRQAFRDLNGPFFEIGTADLLPYAPTPFVPIFPLIDNTRIEFPIQEEK